MHKWRMFRIALTICVLLTSVIGAWLWSVGVRWQFVSAAQRDDVRTVKAFLDQGMPPDMVSHIGGIRAISMAAYAGLPDVVRLLLDRGANPTYGVPQAILKNRADILRLLVARGATIQPKDKSEIDCILKAEGVESNRQSVAGFRQPEDRRMTSEELTGRAIAFRISAHNRPRPRP